MCQQLGKTLCSFLPSTQRSIKGLLWVKGLFEITLSWSSTCLPLSILSWWLDCKLASGNFSYNSCPIVPVLNNIRTNWILRPNHTPTPESPGWWCDPLIMHFLICTWDTWKPHIALLFVSQFLSICRESWFSHPIFHLSGIPGVEGLVWRRIGERSCSLFQTQ